tara:strand:+ start:289 stop:534 length:246 start_codon:yes stop_codon:yes gene_type:complete
MLDLTKLPELNENHEYLIDNPDYSELYERLNLKNMEDYLIVYSYIHNIFDVTEELIKYNIEFSHQSCHLSDESYLLINIKQ